MAMTGHVFDPTPLLDRDACTGIGMARRIEACRVFYAAKNFGTILKKILTPDSRQISAHRFY